MSKVSKWISEFFSGLDQGMDEAEAEIAAQQTKEEAAKKSDIDEEAELAAKAAAEEQQRQLEEEMRRNIYLGTAGDVVLTPDELRRHTYIIGKTGCGKSSMMKQMMLQDFYIGRGFALIDPGGDCARDMIGLIPEHRLDDVTYFAPLDKNTAGFNPFAMPYEPWKVAADLMQTFKLFFADSWGKRMENLLRYSFTLLILDHQHHQPRCLADLRRLLLEDDWRNPIVQRCPNEGTQHFWLHEFPSLPKDATQPILNKLSEFLAPTSPLERVFSSPANAIDFPALMDNRKVLIANLSKDLGKESTSLLAGMLVSGFGQAALARASIPEQERVDFHLYADEFQNYAVGSFAEVFSEARKFRLCCIIANQQLGQLQGVPQVRSAIIGNVCTVAAMQLSTDDAPLMTKLMNEPRYWVEEKWTTGGEEIVVEPARWGGSEKTPIMFERAKMGRSPRVPHREIKYLSAEERAKALQEGASPRDFNKMDYPSVDDFGQLPRFTAFVRVNRNDDITRVEFPMPPTPSRQVRAAFLYMQQERLQATAEPVPSPTSAPATKPAREPPETPEDYSY